MPRFDDGERSQRRVGGFRALTTGIPLLDAIVVTGFTSVYLGKGLIGVRTWLHRRRFFAPQRALVSRSVA